MQAHLFPFTDEDPFLHPREVARRIGTHFTNAVVDWDSANTKLQAELERLEEAGTPEPILIGHRRLFNNVVYIEVRSYDETESGVRFFAYQNSRIDLESFGPPNHACVEQERRLVSEIAKSLEYDVEFEV
jgi:hypothetical protein